MKSRYHCKSMFGLGLMAFFLSGLVGLAPARAEIIPIDEDSKLVDTTGNDLNSIEESTKEFGQLPSLSSEGSSEGDMIPEGKPEQFSEGVATLPTDL